MSTDASGQEELYAGNVRVKKPGKKRVSFQDKSAVLWVA